MIHTLLSRTLERAPLALLAGLMLLCLAFIYGGGLGNEFIFDDDILRTVVPEEYGSLVELKPRLLSYGSFVWIDAVVPESLSIQVQRFFNVLLHFLTALGLYCLHARLLRAVTGATTNHAIHPALSFGVLLFACNPVAVYAVAYLVQRSILMATMFVVWALYCFVRGIEKKRSQVWFVAALFFYICALLSKEYAIAAPLLVIWLYMVVCAPPLRQLLIIGGAMLGFAALMAGVLFHYYGQILGTPFDSLSKIFLDQLAQTAPDAIEDAWLLSILNQAMLFFRYGILWVVPNVALMSIDLRPPFPVSILSFWHFVGALAHALLWLIALYWLILGKGTKRLLGAYLLMPLSLFVTEFATVWIQDPFVLYRSYLWAIALPGLFALLLMRLRPGTVSTLSMCVIPLFAVLSHERVSSLENHYTAWTDAIQAIDEQAPASAVGRWRAYMNRGGFHLEHGAYQSALNDFESAIRLGEPHGSAWYSLGTARALMGDRSQAVQAFERAEAQGFTDAALYFQRGEVLRAQGEAAAALADYREMAQRADQDKVRELALRRVTETALAAGQLEDVVWASRAMLETRDDRGVRLNLGMALLGLKRHDEALELFRGMVRANNADPAATYGLALSYFLGGEPTSARFMAERAARLEPRNPTYRKLLQDIEQQLATPGDATQ
ncbi:MAG: tetratricopeptide repeat protein [Rhodocyclaceae bacterium]